jgi:formylglycine-generating enzyme required for sulfatase activity
MMNTLRILCSFFVLYCLLTTAHASSRVALVIGNSNYQIKPLANPVNDASDITVKLQQQGFEVEKLIDANVRDMKEAIARFGKKLEQQGAVGLFYYAGHGVQVNNRNYLIPLNANIQSEADIEFEAIDTGRVLGQMKQAGNDLNLVILDACRDNPYANQFRSTATRGLARMNVPAGSLILYATSPGDVARDGSKRNGLFTSHLLKAMGQPGLKVEEVFKQTAIGVSRATGKKQVPWLEGVILGDFYFVDDSTLERDVKKFKNNPQNFDSLYVQSVEGLQTVVFEMVNIPKGSFKIGSYDEYENETPVSLINIKTFQIGKTEVTQELWKAVMNNNPSETKYCDSCPVENVSWDDIQVFLRKLNKLTGKYYRLPSESEWEYAARGGVSSIFSWGDKISHDDANFGANECCDGMIKGRDQWEFTSPVGSFDSNRFGLYDVTGNVMEWVQDCWRNNYSEIPGDGRALNFGNCDKHTFRGGSWLIEASRLRLGYRWNSDSDDHDRTIGFRLARSLIQ